MFSKAKSLLKIGSPPPPPKTPTKPRFSEKRFLEEFNALLEGDNGEQALDYFLSQLGDFAGSSIQRRIKLNHLRYASRILENRTPGKHGFEKLTRKLRSVHNTVAGIDLPKGSFLDFGCGEHDPLGLATAHYLNGFDRAIACDLVPIHVPAYSAFSMYEILANMLAFPENYLRQGGNLEQFKSRLAEFDLQPFLDCDFSAGVASLKGKIDYRLDDILNLDVADEELSLTVSFAVLEHVINYESVYEWLFRKTKPGGVQYHFIDLVDHRYYFGTGEFNEWSFLSEETGPDNVNRLRVSEHRALLEQAGFEIIKERHKSKAIPEEARETLLPPWSDMPDTEINTTKMWCLLRRPA